MKTLKDTGKASYNVIFVGETGVGKFIALELIANVLAINHYHFGILAHTAELKPRVRPIQPASMNSQAGTAPW